MVTQMGTITCIDCKSVTEVDIPQKYLKGKYRCYGCQAKIWKQAREEKETKKREIKSAAKTTPLSL